MHGKTDGLADFARGGGDVGFDGSLGSVGTMCDHASGRFAARVWASFGGKSDGDSPEATAHRFFGGAHGGNGAHAFLWGGMAALCGGTAYQPVAGGIGSAALEPFSACADVFLRLLGAGIFKSTSHSHV